MFLYNHWPCVIFLAKLLMRIKVVAQAVEYCLDTGRALSAAEFLWTDHLCNFQAEKESLNEMKKNTTNMELPVSSNNLTIIDWFDTYNTLCDDYIRQSGAPLSLVSRPFGYCPYRCSSSSC